MAEIDPKLNEILSDENRLQQVLELAQMLSRNGGTAGAGAPRQTESQAPPPPQPLSTADILAALAGTPGGPSTPPPQAPPQSGAATDSPSGGNFSAVLEVLPGLLQAFSGSGNVLPENKVNLVQAIRPYASEHANSFDRALRMANIAKAAKSAINTLGNKQT